MQVNVSSGTVVVVVPQTQRTATHSSEQVGRFTLEFASSSLCGVYEDLRRTNRRRRSVDHLVGAATSLKPCSSTRAVLYAAYYFTCQGVA